MFGLGKIPKGLRAWKAWGRFDKRTKEIWAMEGRSWKTVTGGILTALAPLALGILPLLNVPPEQIKSIAAGLAALGIALGGIGVAHGQKKTKDAIRKAK